jgi:hypothetical protein
MQHRLEEDETGGNVKAMGGGKTKADDAINLDDSDAMPCSDGDSLVIISEDC